MFLNHIQFIFIQTNLWTITIQGTSENIMCSSHKPPAVCELISQLSIEIEISLLFKRSWLMVWPNVKMKCKFYSSQFRIRWLSALGPWLWVPVIWKLFIYNMTLKQHSGVNMNIGPEIICIRQCFFLFSSLFLAHRRRRTWRATWNPPWIWTHYKLKCLWCCCELKMSRHVFKLSLCFNHL